MTINIPGNRRQFNLTLGALLATSAALPMSQA